MKKDNFLYSNVNLILRIGSYSAFVLLVSGFILVLIASRDSAGGSGEMPLSFRELMSSLSGLKPQGVVNLGLLALMFTPMLRVIMALFSFWRLQDYRYGLISLGVFLILFTGLMVAVF